MNQRTRPALRSRRTMTPSLDQLESRQLLSAAPVHGHAEALRHHHAAVVEHARDAHEAATQVSAAAATQVSAAAATTDAATSGFSVAAAPSGVLTATAAIADNDIWAVGYSETTTPETGTVIVPVAEHFNGTSWTSVPTPALAVNPYTNSSDGQFQGVAAVSSNDVWAVGYGGANGALIEHWNGTAWSVVASPEGGNSAPAPHGTGLDAVTAISANDVLAVGQNNIGTTANGSGGGALVEQWNGTAWNVIPDTGALAVSGATDTDIIAISADSATDIWALERNADGTENLPEYLIHSTNGGLTWTQVVATGGTSLTAISPTDVWITTNPVTDELDLADVHTADFEQWNGTTLTAVPAAAKPAPPTSGEHISTFLTGITAISANDIIAVGVTQTFKNDGAIGPNGSAPLIEQWNGTSWSIVSIAGSTTGELEGVTALSDGTIIAVGALDITNPADETLGAKFGNASGSSPSLIVQN
jgi:hypothetical protein